jgi:hypothetical protein
MPMDEGSVNKDVTCSTIEEGFDFDGFLFFCPAARN